jgi:hypothetical protein
MLGHRVNSEGLRRHATALSGNAPKRRYIVFGLRFCQPSDTRRITEKAAIFAGFAERRRSAVRGRCRGALRTGFMIRIRHLRMLRRTAATFLRRSLHNPVGTSPLRGKRPHHLRFNLRPPGRVDGPGPPGHRARGYSAHESGSETLA